MSNYKRKTIKFESKPTTVEHVSVRYHKTKDDSNKENEPPTKKIKIETDEAIATKPHLQIILGKYSYEEYDLKKDDVGTLGVITNGLSMQGTTYQPVEKLSGRVFYDPKFKNLKVMIPKTTVTLIDDFENDAKVQAFVAVQNEKSTNDLKLKSRTYSQGDRAYKYVTLMPTKYTSYQMKNEDGRCEKLTVEEFETFSTDVTLVADVVYKIAAVNCFYDSKNEYWWSLNCFVSTVTLSEKK